MPPARRVCSTPGCPNLTDRGRCTQHRKQAAAERGTAQARGYGQQHRLRFRPAVLARDPVCTTPDCGAPSTVADHWPLDRRTLVARGMDPDDPRHGRGLCAPHHNRHTARTSPAGWHRSTTVTEGGG